MPTEEAANRAREINAAYSVLSNPDRRADYDASMAEHRVMMLFALCWY